MDRAHGEILSAWCVCVRITDSAAASHYFFEDTGAMVTMFDKPDTEANASASSQANKYNDVAKATAVAKKPAVQKKPS
eukprot:14312909-Alexandrium_andersonii.AAC.1